MEALLSDKGLMDILFNNIMEVLLSDKGSMEYIA